MGEKELIDMVINERIGALLKATEADGQLISDWEDVMAQAMGEERRSQAETCINSLVEEAARNERAAYRGGFRDGVRLMWKIWGMGREG